MCSFHQIEVNILEFHLKDNRLFLLWVNFQKVNSFPVPATRKAEMLSCFMWYPQVINSIIYTANGAFSHSYLSITSLLMVKHRKQCKTFFLNTDASGFGISAVLMQEANGILLPIPYFSKGLRGAEKCYAPMQPRPCWAGRTGGHVPLHPSLIKGFSWRLR